MSGKLAGYVTAALTVGGGILAGQAIRNGVHHGHLWPLLGALGVLAWAGAWLTLWLPYRAGRRKLLRERRILLGMMTELNEMAGIKPTSGEQR